MGNLPKQSHSLIFNMAEATITPNTKIQLAVVVTIAGAIFSWGVLYQKVNNVEERMARMENKVDLLLTKNNTLTSLNDN